MKVPHPQLVQRPEDAELYLKEARTVAGLEHPNIVPVLEVGSTPEFPIFVVSKYIQGCDLAAHISLSPPTSKQAVQWIMDLADALRTAHKQGIVHRDVKPQNVLVDFAENVYLVDFGLALRDKEVGKRLPAGGTPAYMSPEQAKGEGHRVDGRSDTERIRYDESLDLVGLLTAIRRGRSLPANKKLLIVIDQFEQWLSGSEVFGPQGFCSRSQCGSRRCSAELAI